jgi:hypothetical protein
MMAESYATLLEGTLPTRLRLGEFTVFPQEEHGVASLSAYTRPACRAFPPDVVDHASSTPRRRQTESPPDAW